MMVSVLSIWSGRRAAGLIELNTRRTRVQRLRQLGAGDVEYVAIPLDPQAGRMIGKILRHQVFRGHRG